MVTDNCDMQSILVFIRCPIGTVTYYNSLVFCIH